MYDRDIEHRKQVFLNGEFPTRWALFTVPGRRIWSVRISIVAYYLYKAAFLLIREAASARTSEV